MAGYAEPGRQPGVGLEEGWFQTSDLGYLSPEGAVTVLGRADQILVIGGEAVVPSRVEERLLAAPGLEAVAVVALPDPMWGHRLVAAYTGDTSPEALETWCRRHLPDRERPRGFHRCAALPILASGKLDPQGIKALYADLQPAGDGARMIAGEEIPLLHDL
jgi:O-succinylbenzoic acid--CoA ligase